jgi:hypothetical protein
LGAARAAAAGHDVVVDDDDLLAAIELYDATLEAFKFAQASTTSRFLPHATSERLR